MILNWRVSKEDDNLILAIAQRAASLSDRYGVEYPVRDAIMDLTATHANGNRLRLADLAAADERNFAHDVWGIRRHLDRETGRLTDCFRPRFSA